MPNMPIDDLKTLRNELLMQRRAFAQTSEADACLHSLTGHLDRALSSQFSSVKSIALYWPIQEEIDLRDTLKSWASALPDRCLALPVTREDRHLDFWEWRDGDLLVPNQYRIPEPDQKNTQISRIDPDCILIPCVGWSLDHNPLRASKELCFWRLGYGGGFFDRTLAQLRKRKPGVICIGVAFDWQKLNPDQWQAAAHDELLDGLLTESGLHLPNPI